MAQKLVVFLIVGGVAGFGAVFLQLPGIVLAVVVLAVVAGTGRRRADLFRVGGYLFVSGWLLVTGYAVVAVAGCALVAAVAVSELRRGRSLR